MEIQNRKSIYDNLSKYCHHHKDNDYIEVTEWANGEGYTIDINDKTIFNLTYGELDAINYIVKSLDFK